ncbi:hypothetical protein [Micromonospora sp. NPDC053811]|uniref:hypothetical protein n=1 Tax=Micromonospora sp. NPDC053811 TaxID=3154956 RepID=UPI003434140F
MPRRRPPGPWRWSTAAGHTIKVSGARLASTVQNPQSDAPTQDGRSPYLDSYLAANTTTLSDVGRGTFPLRPSRNG